MKRIAVYSGTGGVGKSFIAANLAALLFQRGVRVTLCDPCQHNPISLYFGGSVFAPGSAEADKAAVRANLMVSSGREEPLFRSHDLHSDFTLLATRGDVVPESAESLRAAIRLAERGYSDGEVMIIDLPAHFRPPRRDAVFDVELEVVAAEPASIAAACRRHHLVDQYASDSEAADNHYVILNKKDLRSGLSRDAAHLAGSVFGTSILATIHYDTAVSEALAHKSLLNDYAPQSQAALDLGELSRRVTEVLEIASRSDSASPESRMVKPV